MRTCGREVAVVVDASVSNEGKRCCNRDREEILVERVRHLDKLTVEL